MLWCRMNILETIVNAGGGRAVSQLGSQVGLDEAQTTAALSALVPALAAGVHRNVQSEGGLAGLLSALGRGGHEEYLDNPTALSDPKAVDQGNGVLGHVLGSKDASRDVAERAAAQTGLGADVLKRMLPLAATLLMGALARNSGGASTMGLGAGGGILDMLKPMLEGGQGGTMANEVSGMLGRMFGHS
jgi:hypothetical protein